MPFRVFHSREHLFGDKVTHVDLETHDALIYRSEAKHEVLAVSGMENWR